MAITVTLSGDGIDFEREVNEAQAADIVMVALTGDTGGDDAATDDEPEDENSGAASELPESFVSRLSRKQEAYVRTLLDADGWLTNEAVRERMADERGVETGGPQSISGIRAGFTRKYGDGFDVDEQRWTGEQNEYRLNPAYADDLASMLDL
ncbi:hypothetical protein G9464_18160 [Halostella sp. JP-L12]|uniref:hypothetical protein n=1 Tax=Halostella TaxID=1843185 RepID=UPI000EF7C28E|nr:MULTISPECIES: hypothetical protein [Halostella]NHN49497.1 hypothetical protein [Halostella sp. JP-L12]